MKTSIRGRALIKSFESFVGHAYPDPYSPLGKALRIAGLWRQYMRAPIPRDQMPAELRQLSGAPWTIGWGFTDGVKEGDTMSRVQADVRLIGELNKYEAGVSQAAGVCNENQFDALVCFAWNVGIAGMANSSVIKAHRRGDFQSAARSFGLWNKAGGQVVAGLTRRRAAESALYLEPVALPEDDEVPEPMPQAVEPERRMVDSTINRAGVVAGGTAAVATVAETVNTVANVKHGIDSLGEWLVPVLLLAVVGLCAYIVWERIKQRRLGWS